MKPDKTLYYVDFIHYSEAEGNKRINADNTTVQVALLDVSENINEGEKPKDIIVPVSTNQLSIRNGKRIADNNFVYYSANNQCPFENGNKDPRALELINRSSRLRKELRKKSRNRPMELLQAGTFIKSKITSYHINVGHGNCSVMLIECGNSYRIWMVDCGTAYFVEGPHLDNIDDCFDHIAKRLSVTKDKLSISLFMLTHLHSDHYNGIEVLFNRGYCNAGTSFFINLDYAVAAPTYIRILELIDKKGCYISTPIRNVVTGDAKQPMPMIIFPDRRVFKNYYPSIQTPYYYEQNTNNSSVVYIINGSGKSMMFPGDMEKKELDKMTESGNCTPYLNRINYYCVSHHASITGHLNCNCLDPKHPCLTCLDCCKFCLNKAIVMGRDRAFTGIYNQTVISDFGPAVAYSEKDSTGKSVKCLILDWSNDSCSYLY